jgi:hypothetical protein
VTILLAFTISILQWLNEKAEAQALEAFQQRLYSLSPGFNIRAGR